VGRSVSSSAAQLEMDIVLGHVAAGCFQSFHECLSPGKGMGHGEVDGPKSDLPCCVISKSDLPSPPAALSWPIN
jgi:hypothetical protein